MDEKQGFTYRVEYVPNGMSKHILVSLFHPEDAQHLEIRSLTPDVNNYDGTGHQVATIYYSPPNQQRELRLRNHDSDLVLDRAFLGFTPLNETLEVPTADLIAVTGLAGHAFGSWAHTRRRMWLRDYLPGDIQRRARVLVYGYNSQVQGHDTPTSILADHGNRFVNDLLRIRTHAACRDRPLILIGHSLGGLIIKQALTDLASGLRSMLPVKRVIFLGVPHGGLDQTALVDIVQAKPPQELITELKRNSPTLRGLAQRFKSNCCDLVVHTYYESRMTNTVVQSADGKLSRCGPPVLMVDGTSAIMHHSCEVSVVSVDGNHSEIAKLKRGQGGAYVDIHAHVEDALQDIEHAHKLSPLLHHPISASPWRFDTSERKPTQTPLDLSPPCTINSVAIKINRAGLDTGLRAKASCVDSDVSYAEHSGSCRSPICVGGELCKLENDEPESNVTPSSSGASVQNTPEAVASAELASVAADAIFDHSGYCRTPIACTDGPLCRPENESDIVPSSSEPSAHDIAQSTSSAEPGSVTASTMNLTDVRRCRYTWCRHGHDCTLKPHIDAVLSFWRWLRVWTTEPTAFLNTSDFDTKAYRVEMKKCLSEGRTTPYLLDLLPWSLPQQDDVDSMADGVPPNSLVSAESDPTGDGASQGVTAGQEGPKAISGQSATLSTIVLSGISDIRFPTDGLISNVTSVQHKEQMFLQNSGMRDKDPATGLVLDSETTNSNTSADEIPSALPPRTNGATTPTTPITTVSAPPRNMDQQTIKPRSFWRAAAQFVFAEIIVEIFGEDNMFGVVDD
ncbi:hypothetical protein LTS10_007629 [Elasticomyces elasticus]|nr:hypothetical protein LTS10_007629 [Elasticomyces elasticus]